MTEVLYEVRGAARFFQRGPATVSALDGQQFNLIPTLTALDNVQAGIARTASTTPRHMPARWPDGRTTLRP